MDNTNANKGCNKAVGAALHTPQASGQPPYLRGAVIGALVAAIVAAVLAFASCNVTRTVTTSAQTIQRGDTTTIIQTKTIETYDGSVDATKLLKK